MVFHKNSISQLLLDDYVSIISCIQVDFKWQVSAESIGTLQISGVGGQVDFVRGANHSKDGRSIIAMISTAILIEIAHPDFRPELICEWESRFHMNWEK